MLVHLGRGVSVRGEDVVAMTDLSRPLAADTAAVLASMRASGAVTELGPEPKTMLLCCSQRRGAARSVCYLSCVGLRTLRRRMEAGAAADDNED